MIEIRPCVIELDVDSTHYLVSDKNKMKGFSEHKGETDEGNPTLFYVKDNKALFPREILYYFGTYKVVYI